MVDDSKGHSAYAKATLLVSQKNVRPAGKQACMHNGWYMQDGQKVSQPMVFPSNHPEFPNEPKGIKAVLGKWGIFHIGLHRKCQNKCDSDQDDCFNKCILEQQP